MHAIPARRRLRRLAFGVAVLAALLAAAPASAALPGFAWPTQSLGNRGVDVKAIQSLLRGRGFHVRYDGIYSADTAAGVKAFQAAVGLPAHGIVNTPTWQKLVVIGRAGAPREPVLTLQRLLNEKRGAGLAVTGSWNGATATAVRAFERHVGLPVDGVADVTVWRYLIAHFDRPAFSAAGLCDYSVGNGPANWGTGAAIGQIEAAARIVAAAGYGRVPVGDISLEHPGEIAGHETHERGLDVDVRPVRDRRNQCTWGTSWRAAAYDRSATRALLKAIRATAPGHVKLIYFNDPVLIREGWTTWYAGHDDHLHVRYCELQHALAAYRC